MKKKPNQTNNNYWFKKIEIYYLFIFSPHANYASLYRTLFVQSRQDLINSRVTEKQINLIKPLRRMIFDRFALPIVFTTLTR